LIIYLFLFNFIPENTKKDRQQLTGLPERIPEPSK